MASRSRQSQHAGQSPNETPEGGAGDPEAGAEVFAENCAGCHGVNGLGGSGGPSLAGVTDLERIRAQVVNGGGGMPAFRGQLTQQQINDVSAYVAQRIGR